MGVWQILAMCGAGLAAGIINVVVGSGTLITFPTLLALGFPPVTANVSNSLGLVPGSLAGAIGYRKELAHQRARVLKFGAASVLGAVGGAFLLLNLPADAFTVIVPVLIALALILVVLQPKLAKWVAARRDGEHAGDGGPWLLLAVFGTGVYGGYFGASQGIIMLGVTGVVLGEDIQKLNALKNATTGMVNLVSGLIFIFIAHVAWEAVVALAVGSVLGGLIGARIGKRLPPTVLRGVIVVVGLIAIGKLVLG